MDTKDLPQPLGFFHVITQGGALHYGYWPQDSKDDSCIDLSQAQQLHSQLIMQRLPKPPATVLDVGCGLGEMAGKLHELGYQVTAIAPSESLIAYAKNKYQGPNFINCGFLDDYPGLQSDQFDVVLFQESLQYFPDLPVVFKKSAKLLSENGRLIVCDEVSYDDSTLQRSSVHPARAIESSFSAQGFYIHNHASIGEQVTPTCGHILEGLSHKSEEIITIFGPEVKEQIEQLKVEWKNLQGWYQNKVFGYELWELRGSSYSVRPYAEQDEVNIVKQFNQAFQQNRSLEHWQWKFLSNPQGGPCISNAWDGDELASHYCAYPLLITAEGETAPTYHIGDTFTLPAWRGVGRGATSLLSRVVRHFHRNWCEGKVDFFYGFNTGKIQKFGELFLSYVPIIPVYEYSLPVQQPSFAKNLLARCSSLLAGYEVTIVDECGAWADELFEQAKSDYNLVVVRDQRYLTWRYDQHPDFTYQYRLLKKRGKVVGWWVTRQAGKTLLLIDAFCMKEYRKQMLDSFQKSFGKETAYSEISGWFASNPNWWHEQLVSAGFEQKRQADNLDLCATFFSEKYNRTDLAEKFYFTMGDTDLY